MTGKIKTVRADKGYGFIAPENDIEIFFHHSALENATLRDVKPGDRVNFEAGHDRGRRCAVSVSVIR